MPKKLIQRLIPHPSKLKENRSLRFLGQRIHDPNLWHLNRRSVAMAFSVGIFCAFLPIPMQMLVAASLALWLRCNLPLSVALVWITNPITMPAIFYFTYRVGCLFLHQPENNLAFEPTAEWLASELHHIWWPLLLGSIISGLAFSGLSYLGIRLYWRWSIVRMWKARRFRQQHPDMD